MTLHAPPSCVALAFLLLNGCPSGKTGETGTVDGDTDSGADSDSAGDDCDDNWYADLDGDGFGDPGTATVACDPPLGTVSNGTDCDDGHAAIHPGAPEICDGLDNDCDKATVMDNAVTQDDGTSFSSIQAAIDASSPGDTLSLCAATYPEAIRISHDLRIIGMGAGATMIDATGKAASAVFISGGSVSLEGLTITGGSGTPNDGNTWGGGIYGGRSDGLFVTDCVIEGNIADFGGGITGTGLYPSMDTITRTIIRDNEAAYGGGGFLLFHASLESVEVTENSSSMGGGGTAWYWDVTADDDTLLHDNQAADGGGGLFLWDAGAWSGGQIRSNASETDGGGVLVADNTTMSGAIIADNTAAGSGGGVAVMDATLAAEGLTIQSNVAGTAGGGAWLSQADFICVTCDLGTDGNDNSPDDITLDLGASSVSYEAGDDVSFDCSTRSGGCVGL